MSGRRERLHVNRTAPATFALINIAGFGPVRVTRALAGHHVGIREDADGRWLVSFATLDLGFAQKGKSLAPLTPNHPESQP